MSPAGLAQLTAAILDLDEGATRRFVDRALDGGVEPAAVLDAARTAMGELGRRFETGEAFLPELVMAGELMAAVADTVTPLLKAGPGAAGGRIVLGTVRGDIHDIGKNIVATLLRAAGYEVTDLGVDVSPDRFVEAAAESGADVVGLSCLLTVGFAPMKETVEALREASPEDGARVMIGGAAVTQALCEHTGADGWGADAPAAVALAREWTSERGGGTREAAAGDAAPAENLAGDTIEAVARVADRSGTDGPDATGAGAGVPAADGSAAGRDGWEPGASPDELFAARFDAWQRAEHLEFAGPEVAGRYRRHAGWIRDTIALKGEVVPVCGSFLHYPFRELGVSVRRGMYDDETLSSLLLDFHAAHMPDAISVDPLLPGPVFDLLDCRQWVWPGHGVDDEGAFQWVEGEYMRADEYELLIDDPTRFWLTRYLPRVFPVLAPLAELPPLTDIDSAAVTGVLGALATDEAGAMFDALRAAARASVAYDEGLAAAYDGVSAALGLPAWFGGAVTAPYDTLANELRGARSTMTDTMRRRDLVKAAVARLTPPAIDKAVRAADLFGVPIVLIPLHWGSDGFMSDGDFRELYWPPLEALIRGCVEAGVVPLLWTEADYSTRLPVIAEAELPPGRTLWGFEHTPMKLARETIGDRCAITGNLSVSLLELGTEEEVRGAVRQLFDDAAGDSNFLFNLGATVDEARPENVRAMFAEAKRLSGRGDED